MPFAYQKISHENQNLWFIQPNKIDLKEYIQRPKFEEAALDLTYTKHLVAIDGFQPEIAENVRELGFEGNQMYDETMALSVDGDAGEEQQKSEAGS